MVMMKCSCMHLLMVLATIQALYGTVLMQGDCRVRYVNEPGPTTQSCNIFGSGVNITCYVKGDLFLHIHWHYSSDPSLVGVTNQSTYYSASNSLYSTRTESYVILENNLNYRRDHFFISKVNNSTVGYYWCSIRGQPTPSQVVHIEKQCNTLAINSCNSPPLLSQGATYRCANISNQNVSIVNAQNLQCDSTSTPTPKINSTTPPTTEDNNTPETTVSTEDKSSPETTVTTVEDKNTLETTVSTEDKSSPETTVTTVEDKNTPETTTVEDISNTELTTAEDKPTNSQTTQPATDVITKETPNTIQETIAASTATTIEEGDGIPQGGGSLPTDVIWLAIGIVLAFLLVGVFILLAIIAVLQCKKRRIKGVTSPTSRPINDFVESGGSAIVLRDIGGQLDKKTEGDSEPLYEEIPAAVPGNLIRLGVPNPILISSSTSNTMTRDDHMMPLSPGSGQYVDMSVQLALRPPRTSSPNVQYETITPDRLEQHSINVQRPSNSSIPNSPPILDTNDCVFDDPKYDIILDSSPPTTKKHSKVLVSLSAPQAEHNHLEIDENDYKQKLSEYTGKSEISRKLSYDSHTYTPVQPTQSKKSNYAFAIVSTEENYISEQGHLYHVLESSTQSRLREESNSPKQTMSPVSSPDDCVFEEPSYHVLENSADVNSTA